MTGPVDLAGEMKAAAARIRQPHLDRLRALGVTGETITRIWHDVAPIGVANAETDSHGHYMPGEGPLHLIQPVHAGDVLVDLVAWRSGDPGETWLRTGHGWAIGESDLLAFDRWHGDLMLHASPLDWLRAGATGAVILDWSAPEIARLRDHDRIRCATATLAAALRRAIAATIHMPDIIALEDPHAP